MLKTPVLSSLYKSNLREMEETTRNLKKLLKGVYDGQFKVHFHLLDPQLAPSIDGSNLRWPGIELSNKKQKKQTVAQSGLVWKPGEGHRYPGLLVSDQEDKQLGPVFWNTLE